MLVIARTYPTADFGHFAIAYSILVLILGLSRSYLGTQVSMSPDSNDCRELATRLLGGIMLLALPSAALVFGLATLITGGPAELLWVVAFAAPLVCAQDLVRFCSIAMGKPGSAFLSDLVWLALMALVFFLPLQPGLGILMSWLGAIAVSLGVGLVVSGLRPRFRGSLKKIFHWEPVAASMAWGSLMAQGSQLVITSVAATVVGPQAAAALRGASTLVGPVNVIFAYVNVAITPALMRRSRNADIRFARILTFAVATIASVWGLALLLLPDAWGTAALGASWPVTKSIIWVTAIQYVGLSLASGSTLALKVRRKAKILAWQKFIVAVLAIVLAIGGTLMLDDVIGAAAGLAVAGFVGAILGWSALLHAHRSDNV